MRRVTLSVLFVGLLVALSSLAVTLVNAAPVAQTTSTPRATTTARSTRTPLATRTQGSAASPEATEEATPEATVEATEATTDTDDLTATPEATDDEVLTDTSIITGTVLPLRLANPTDVDPGRTLTVVGIGTITTTPDIAVLTLGVETTNTDATTAAEENNQVIADILELIDELEIPRRNVRTSTFNIFVERPPQEPVGREEGTVEPPAPIYHVTQQITIRIEDIEENLELVSDLIGEALEAGANNVFGPTFELGENNAIQQRARRAAVENAYARAQDWATLTGVELIGVATVSEVVGGGASPLPYLAERAAQEGGGGGPSLQPGVLSYSEQIQVVFYIR